MPHRVRDTNSVYGFHTPAGCGNSIWPCLMCDIANVSYHDTFDA
jgi:hypothetical protein